MRHTWLNNPTKQKRVCTRCGCTKTYLGHNTPHAWVYELNGKEYDFAPECK